jgi:ketosteroid isomerase-like protein/predicted ester cyclase
MNTTRVLLLAACLAVAALAQPVSTPPQPGPALQRLQIRHGDWTYVQEFRETPVWTAGKTTGTATTRPTLAGFGSETTFTEPAPWGSRQRTETNWLDPRTNDIGYVLLGNDGRVEQGICVFTGDSWTWQGTFPAVGTYWKTRGKGTFSADHNTFTQTGEISQDGNVWIPAFTRTATRAAPPQPVAAPGPEVAQAELLALENEWAKAYLSRDLPALDRIEADDWAYTAPSGEVIPKTRDIAEVASGSTTAAEFVLSDLKVRVYGDTAIVTGRQQKVAPQGGKDAGGVLQLTDTWRRSDGRWRCHATHLSRIVPPLDTTAIRRDVLQLIQGMRAAQERLDAAAALSCHANLTSYLWTDIDGSLHRFADTRDRWADFLAGCAQLRFTTKREEVEVIDSDNALYLWHGAVDSTSKDGLPSHHDSWTSCYLVRRSNGTWQIIGGQESSAPLPPPPLPPPSIPGPAVGAAEARNALEAYVTGFWSKRDPEALARALTPTMIYHRNGELRPGAPADHLGYLTGFGGAFPDLTGSIDTFTFADGIGAASVTWTGTHTGELAATAGSAPVPPTGRKVTIATNYVFRVEAGRIVELWETWDEGSLHLSLTQPTQQPAAP